MDQFQKVETQHLAVFRKVSNASVDSFRDGVRFHLLAVDKDFATLVDTVGMTEDGTSQLCTTGTHQTRKADHFTGTDVDGRALADETLGVQRMAYPPVLDLELHFARMRLLVRVAVFKGTTDHQANDLVLVDLFLVGVHPADRLAVTNNRDGIRDGSNFVELVRDHDHRDAAFALLAHQVEKVG